MGGFSAWHLLLLIAVVVLFAWRLSSDTAKARSKLQDFAAAGGFQILSQKPLLFYIPPIRFWFQLGRSPFYYALLTADGKGIQRRLILAIPIAIIQFGAPKDPVLLESVPFNPRLDRF